MASLDINGKQVPLAGRQFLLEPLAVPFGQIYPLKIGLEVFGVFPPRNALDCEYMRERERERVREIAGNPHSGTPKRRVNSLSCKDLALLVLCGSTLPIRGVCGCVCNIPKRGFYADKERFLLVPAEGAVRQNGFLLPVLR